MRSQSTARPLLALTPGDPAGIGPEIVWKAIRAGIARKLGARLLCVGAREPFDRLKVRVIEADLNDLTPPRESRPHVWLLPAPTKVPARRFLPGYQSGWSIESATLLALQGRVDAIVTGPISKERLQRGGFKYPGHTEFLADLCGVAASRGDAGVTMMLANDLLRISLVTTHLALADVSRALTAPLIRRAIDQTAEALQRDWGIRRPRIAVCGLNPHAGESGIFGREEIRVIEPAIRSYSRRTDLTLVGPLPADTLFANHILAKKADRYDAVVCMYHDQGLIPVKLLDFKNTVNVTLGLPIVRTSVDHGTGFDIAGKGLADPSSLVAAIRMAALMTQTPARKRS